MINLKTMLLWRLFRIRRIFETECGNYGINSKYTYLFLENLQVLLPFYDLKTSSMVVNLPKSE